MEPKSKTRSIAALLVAALLGGGAAAARAHAQSTPLGTAAVSEHSAEHALLRQMVGTWDVRARMWTGPGAEPIELPPAVAERRLVGGALLEEVMTPAPGTDQDPFTRVAYLNYNDVAHRYEWLSWDTRAPQMMYERNYAGIDPGRSEGNERVIAFYLDSFVLPRWGRATNVAYKQRRIVRIEQDRQVTLQYWTPITGRDAEEFLAFEYVYVRRR